MSAKHMLSILAVLSGLSFNAGAQTEADFGSWCSLQVVKSFDRAFGTIRLENRTFESMSSTECSFAFIGGGYRITPWLTADGGYEFWNINAAGGLITNKAVAGLTASLKFDDLAFAWREKYELALPEGGDAYGTLRSRLRAQYSCGMVTPYVMYEYFNGFSGTGWVRSLHYAGAEFRFAGHHCIDIFYMYHLFPKAGENMACNLLGLGYTLSL